jgi:hypothetical protein
LAIRLNKYLKINTTMQVLQNTIKVAMVDILNFLLVVIGMMLGFSLFAHFTFGSMSESYSSLFLTGMRLLEMMIGVIDYMELQKADPILAPAFFIIFLLFFVYVLVNIFIAILERAYSSVKQTEQTKDKWWLDFSTTSAIIEVAKWLYHSRFRGKR